MYPPVAFIFYGITISQRHRQSSRTSLRQQISFLLPTVTTSLQNSRTPREQWPLAECSQYFNYLPDSPIVSATLAPTTAHLVCTFSRQRPITRKDASERTRELAKSPARACV